jgi:hypothetical protein
VEEEESEEARAVVGGALVQKRKEVFAVEGAAGEERGLGSTEGVQVTCLDAAQQRRRQPRMHVHSPLLLRQVLHQTPQGLGVRVRVRVRGEGYLSASE